MRLSSLPVEERPRERLRHKGAAFLSVPELLAVLLRTGSRGKDVLELSADVLEKFGDLKGLARASDEELMELPGRGDAKACVLLAALELAKRYITAQSSRFVNGILDRLQTMPTEPETTATPLPDPDAPVEGETTPSEPETPDSA